MEELLTLKEIAARLGVPESNLRYYRNRVGEFLPSAGEGRRRRYFPEAVEVLRRTVDLVSQGVSLDRVYKCLSSEQPPEIESVGAISQEAFAEKVAEKILGILRAAGVAAPAGQGGDHAGEAAGGTAERAERLAVAAAARAKAEETARNLRAEADRLRGAVGKLEAEIASLQGRVQEKERIIEQQKSQLIDARGKRMNLERALADARALLERRPAG